MTRKSSALIVAVLRRLEFLLRRFPAFGQIEFHGSLCGTFDVAVNVDRDFEGLGIERNDSRLRRNGNGNRRTHD